MNAGRRARQKARKLLPDETSGEPVPAERQDITVIPGCAFASSSGSVTPDSEE